MRRVMKSELAAPDRVNAPDGLEYCLACYKDFMHLDDRDLSESKMLLNGGADDGSQGYEPDPYGDQRKADKKIGEATHAVIENDMRSQHSWAIKRMTGLATVWKFLQLDYVTVAIAAREQLEIKLRKNFDTAHKFD